MPAQFRLLEAQHYFTEEQFRVPLKFGTGAIYHITCAHVEVLVEAADGRRARGRGNILLSDLWAWPSQQLSHDARDAAMRAAVERICQTALEIAAQPAHPLDISWRLKSALPELGRALSADLALAEPIPLLAVQVCASPLDAALHDACGRALGISSYDLYGPDLCPTDLSAYLGPAFKGLYLSDFLRPDFRPELAVFHLVGGMDKLTASEITPDDPDDGLPVSLDQWIERDGIFCFKVKITGTDIDADVQRTADVARVAFETRQRLGLDPTIFLSVDSNELHAGPEAVVEYLVKLREASPLAYSALLYVEQPTERDLAARRFDMRPVAELKPVLADEGVLDVEAIDLARELGWSGIALKTCKGHAASLLYAAKAIRSGMLLSVQDLTNPGLSLIHSAGLAARLPTVMGVEYNARQFIPWAQEDVQRAHPDIFQVTGGYIRTGALDSRGLGWRGN